jgi:hypothetical protein
VGVVTDSTDPRSPWPVARLDPIARLRVVEAVLPGVAATELVIDAPFDRVWGYVADLERSVTQFDSLVRRVRVRSRAPLPGGGEAIDLQAWGTASPLAMVFDVRLEEGLCLMRARGRLFFVGMAAVPDGARTRFRHAEGVPLPGGRLLRRVFRRTAHGDLTRIARIVAGPQG